MYMRVPSCKPRQRHKAQTRVEAEMWYNVACSLLLQLVLTANLLDSETPLVGQRC